MIPQLKQVQGRTFRATQELRLQNSGERLQSGDVIETERAKELVIGFCYNRYASVEICLGVVTLLRDDKGIEKRFYHLERKRTSAFEGSILVHSPPFEIIRESDNRYRDYDKKLKGVKL